MENVIYKKTETATTTGFRALWYPSQGDLNKTKIKAYTEHRSKIMHKCFHENSSKEFCEIESRNIPYAGYNTFLVGTQVRVSCKPT